MSEEQKCVYYLKIIPNKIILNQQIIYTVHPLTKYKIAIQKNSYSTDINKQWIHAGNHHGTINIQAESMDIIVDLSQNNNIKIINTYTMKLLQSQHKVHKHTQHQIQNTQRQQLIGKQNIFIKNYITKFKTKNLHHFKQKSHISSNYILEYEVFIQQTVQALNRVIQEHQHLNRHNIHNIRSRNNSGSILSDNFSDKINQIEIKGQNRLIEHVSFVSHHALLGSQSKIQPQQYVFTSYNNKRQSQMQKITRTVNKRNNLVLKINKIPMTDRKHYNNNQQQQNEEQQQYQYQQQDSIIQSPQLTSINLKKLSSEEVKPAFQLLSPRKLNIKAKRLPLITDRIEKYQNDQEKRKKLMEDFQIKKLQFKRKIDQNKQKIKERPKPQTERINERKLSRSNSTRSMRTVRLSEWEKLPEQKPWKRKQKEITKVRNKKLLYFICCCLLIATYLLMQPFKNVEESINTTKNNLEQLNKQNKHKKAFSRKSKFKLKDMN